MASRAHRLASSRVSSSQGSQTPSAVPTPCASASISSGLAEYVGHSDGAPLSSRRTAVRNFGGRALTRAIARILLLRWSSVVPAPDTEERRSDTADSSCSASPAWVQDSGDRNDGAPGTPLIATRVSDRPLLIRGGRPSPAPREVEGGTSRPPGRSFNNARRVCLANLRLLVGQAPTSPRGRAARTGSEVRPKAPRQDDCRAGRVSWPSTPSWRTSGF